jgi:hypothetical protein
MADRRTFRILTYSQLSGIKVKAVNRPKYNLYIIMNQCTHYNNYHTFEASSDNTDKTGNQIGKGKGHPRTGHEGPDGK